MKIIQAKSLCEVDFSYGPLFFFGGPIKGGGDWQYRGCLELQKHLEHFYAVIPNRYTEEHPLLRFAMPIKELFPRQTKGERHYLEIAATCGGCVIFWLECESKEQPRTDKNPYARDTYGEVGEWRGRLMHDPNLSVVVGAQKEFPGLDVIQQNFNYALKTQFPIYATLEETVEAAVQKTRQKR